MSENQTPTNTDSKQKENSLKRKSGTIESGHDYEHLTTSKIILELIDNDKIDDFEISSNDNKYGKFDDIIVDLKTDNSNIIYALQLKHRENKNFINISNLKSPSGDFSLQSYCESLKKIKGNFNKLVLYTNAKFNFESNKNDKFSIEDEMIDIRISKYELDELISFPNCYKFDIIQSKADETKTENYRKFFDYFLLCTNQTNCQTTEKKLVEIFRNQFFCGEIEYNRFKNLVKNCCNETKDIKKFNKLWMKEAICLCIVSPRIQSFIFSKANINEKTKLLKEVVSKFNISQFKEKNFEELRKLWTENDVDLTEISHGEINRLRKQYHISLTNIDDVNTVDDKVKTELLWLMKAAPLILKFDDAVKKAMAIYPEGKYIISNQDRNICNQKTFKCLLDVKSVELSLFDKLIKKFKLSLQEKKEINIENFTSECKEFLNFFTADVLLQMAIDNLNVGGKKEEVPLHYINRILKKTLIQFNYVHQADKSTLIIIDGENVEHLSHLNYKLESTESKRTFNDFIIKSNKHQDIINPKADQVKTEEKKIFNCLLHYDDRSESETIEHDVTEILKNDFLTGEKFKNLLEKCSTDKNKSTVKMDRLWIREAIAICNLSLKRKSITSLNDCTTHKSKSIFESEVKSMGKLKVLWKEKKENKVNQPKENYHIISTYMEDINNVYDDIKTYSLLLEKIAPLILKHEKTIEEDTKIHSKQKKVIISNEDKDILNKISTFNCLLDVKSVSRQFFNDLVNKLSVERSDKINIADFIKNNKELSHFFTSDIMFQTAVNNLKVEKDEEKSFDRMLEQISLTFQIVNSSDKNTVIIIFGKNAQVSSNLKCKIEIVGNDCSFKDFEKLCDKHRDCKKFRYFKTVDDGNLLLRYSKGGIEDLEEYKLPIKEKENCFWDLEKSNDINVVISDPGMGKTELLKNLKNNYDSKYWVTILNSADIKLFSEKYDNSVIKFLINEKYKSLTTEEKELLKLMDNGNSVVYIWDGVDEISEDKLDKVIETILELRKSHKKQIVGGRRRVKVKLESKLGLIPIDLAFISEEDRDRYINLRLGKSSQDRTEQVVQAIKKNFALINHSDILGIPLQLYMTTELFIQSKDRYLEKNKTECTLVDLYKYFIDEKFHTYWKEKNKFNYESLDESMMKNLKISQTDYVDLCQQISLKLIFPENLEELRIDSKNLLKRFENIDSNNAVGIIKEISDINSISFIHYSFAEYFVACYLVEKKDIIKERIFEERFNNIRFFRDLLLAKDSPAHVSILYKEFDELAKYDEEILCKKDKKGRNILHLLSSWGKRYSLISVADNNLIDESVDRILVNKAEAEERDYLDTLRKLQERHSFFDEDSLFNLTPISYALKSGCFTTVFILLENLNHFNTSEMASTLLYAIIYGLDDNLHLFQDTEYLNLRFKDNSSLIHLACGSGHLKIVKRLITYGANHKEVDSRQQTPLHLASKYGHENIARYLIEFGDVIDDCDSEGRTPLHYASMNAHEKLAQLLIESGATINQCDSEDRTPLHYASENGHKKVVQSLIESGAAANKCDSENTTPLHCASMNGHVEATEYLIKSGAAVDNCNRCGRTPLHNASINGHENVARKLIEFGAAIDPCDIENATPLHWASINGHEKIAKHLIESGAAIDKCNSFGRTPLHNASMNGHEEVARCLIKSGADTNRCDIENATPLHWASINGHEKVARCLIKSGAAIDKHNSYGRTPLHNASINGHEKMAECLLASDAAVNACDSESATPLHWASFNGHKKVVEILIASGALINQCNYYGRTPLHNASMNGNEKVVQCLIESDAQINHRDSKGNTPLNWASFNGHEKVARCLIESGADINQSDFEGRTPLHEASRNGHENVIKYLIECGALIDQCNSYGRTPLHNASMNGYEKVVKYLIKSGAAVDRCDTGGKTPLYWASVNGHKNVVQYLTEAGNKSINVTQPVEYH